MDKKAMLMVLVVGLVLLASVSATYAARDDEECIAKPTGEIGVQAVTQGMSFIMAGGVGPILILVIAFIIGMVISHLVWGGF